MTPIEERKRRVAECDTLEDHKRRDAAECDTLERRKRRDVAECDTLEHRKRRLVAAECDTLDLSRRNDVVDLHEHAHALGRQVDRTRCDQERLNDVRLLHVGHGGLLHVDACSSGSGTTRARTHGNQG